MIKTAERLTDSDVIMLREKTREDGTIDSKHYANVYDITPTGLGKALRGETFRHLNEISPPVIQFVRDPDIQKKAQDLFHKRMSYDEIAAELNISKWTVAKHCVELSKERARIEKEERDAQRERDRRWRVEERRLGRNTLPPEFSSNTSTRVRTMTSEDVRIMRQEMRTAGRMNLKFYADKFGVSKGMISYAARGLMYKDVNAIEPPILEKLIPPVCKKITLKELVVKELMDLVRKEPQKYTYTDLGKIFLKRTGLDYRPGVISKLMCNRDPSIRGFVILASPQIYKFTCSVCEAPFITKLPTRDTCGEKACAA